MKSWLKNVEIETIFVICFVVCQLFLAAIYGFQAYQMYSACPTCY